MVGRPPLSNGLGQKRCNGLSLPPSALRKRDGDGDRTPAEPLPLQGDACKRHRGLGFTGDPWVPPYVPPRASGGGIKTVGVRSAGGSPRDCHPTPPTLRPLLVVYSRRSEVVKDSCEQRQKLPVRISIRLESVFLWVGGVPFQGPLEVEIGGSGRVRATNPTNFRVPTTDPLPQYLPSHFPFRHPETSVFGRVCR